MELKNMPAQAEWLRAGIKGGDIGVDRDKGIIRGVVLAEEGPFKSEGRGEFDRKAIRQIVKMANSKPGGLKSRFTHPSLSSDGLGSFLGRVKNVRSDTLLRPTATEGEFKEVLAARGDLYFDKSAHSTPNGDLATYVMDLAESDPDAFGTSLVLKVDEQLRIDSKGRRLKDEVTGEDLPPLWYPKELHASDVVDTGDATNSFLSADILAELPDAIVRQGCQLLDQQFASQSREVVEARLTAFVNRYLAYRFSGSESESEAEGFGAEESVLAESVSETPAESVVEASVDDALLLEITCAVEGE